MANTRRRCSECRKTFSPSVGTGARQKVCGAACRAKRDRKLARRRRVRQLEEHREDEAARQRVHRARVRASAEGPSCHAPASGAKLLKLREKVAVLVDRALAMSRATLVRDLAEIVPRGGENLADTG
jgi:hypothetical protein